MKAHNIPAGPLVVDTDVFSLWYRNRGRAEEFRKLAQGHALAMSFACVAEALAPTYMSKGLAPGTNERIKQALSRFVVLPYDLAVVDIWARISGRLEGRLKGGGVNDMWTAACALAHDLPIVSNNRADFQTIQSVIPKLVLIHPDLDDPS